MIKKLYKFLIILLLFFGNKINAAFYNPSTYSQSFTSLGYAARWNPEGTLLAVGGTNYPNDLILYNFDSTYFSQKNTQIFGNGAKALDWSPDGKFLAVGGNNATYSLVIYQCDGKSLTLTTSKYHGTEARAVQWSPNGNYLAVGGNWGTYDLAIYSWDGAGTLTEKTTKTHGTQVNALAWHPVGNKLAVAGNNSSQDLILYNWDGSTLTSFNTQDHGTEACALAWTHTGSWLAVGGNNNTNDVIIYSLNGSTLTLITSVSFGTKANTLDWSFDDRYLAVGGDNGTTDLIIYEWNGTTLTPINNSQISYGNGVYGVNWSPYANYLAVAGDNGSTNINVYNIHGYLNGVKNNLLLSSHFLFTHGGYANGSVNISNGCTVLPAQTLKLALLAPFSGGLDLRTSGILQLEDDLFLDANVTLSSGGFIKGQRHAIYLGNNLTIPDNSVIHIAEDTAIDGQGHLLTLGRWSQLLIDQNATLTLRNLTIQNTLNNPGFPPIKCAASNSKLALDNIELAPTNDFYFNQGQLFIHNDVAFTGTSQFHYMSAQQSYITPNAMLTCEPSTTFFYDTVSTYTPSTLLPSFNKIYPRNNQLINMQDSTSALYLNGSTLQVSHTGLRLTKGQFFWDNNVTLKNNQISNYSSLTLTTSQYHGSIAWHVAWSPNGKYLAVGGDNTNQDLIIYEWNGSTLISKTTKAHGSRIWGCSWSLDGKYLAVGGINTLADLIIYEWDGSNLTQKASLDNGSYAYKSAWAPDGKTIAFSANNISNDLVIYQWDGLTITEIPNASKNFNNRGLSVSWSPDGNFLAVGADNGTNVTNLYVYQWNGSTLTTQDSKTSYQNVNDVSWSLDGRYLAALVTTGNVGGVVIYEWNSITKKLISLGLGAQVQTLGTFALTCRWSNSGKYLVITCYSNSGQELLIYSWNGQALSQIDSYAFGSQATWAEFSPDDQYLAVSGQDTTNKVGIKIYKVNYTTLAQTPAYTQSLFFGNAALGANYDLSLNILNNTRLTKKGSVKYDNVN